MSPSTQRTVLLARVTSRAVVTRSRTVAAWAMPSTPRSFPAEVPVDSVPRREVG